MSTSKTDAARFKREYESYNNKKASDDHKYQKLKIKKKNKIKYINLEEAVDIIKNGTGLIYFGFPNCPYCRSIVPTLLNKVEKSDLKELYYLDMTDLRDTYEVQDERAICTKLGDDLYYELLSILDNYLEDYVVTDENGIEYDAGEKRVYVPLVVAVQDGFIMDTHSNSVDLNESQSPYDPLTKNQLDELGVIFQNLIDTISVK